MTMVDESVQAIAVSHIRKAYGPTMALSDVSFNVVTGTVHALLGENGAGKSTMVKMLSGLVRPDQGEIVIFGEKRFFTCPGDAHQVGLQTAFQELTQIPDLTVWENMLLPYQPVGILGLLKSRAGQEQVSAHLHSLGLGFVSPRAEIRTLDLALRQRIEIARALFWTPRILLLDEPTSALSGDDILWLGEIISRLRANGTTIIFISHRMPEVRDFCDELTILRNGKNVGTFAVSDVSDADVVERIIGRSITATFPSKQTVPATAPVMLQACHLAGGAMVEADLALRAGEILGVAGLQGMGQRDLFLTLFGDIEARAGEIRVAGERVVLRSPRDAINARIGINLVPEERKTEGLFLKLDARINTTLPVMKRFIRHGLIDSASEQQAVAHALTRTQIDQRALYMPARSFSGGNQQKIVLARSLLAGSRILLLFDPTRGVDIGTKHQIYHLIAEFAAAGGAVLLYSTEIAEIVGLSQRVLVIYRGRITGELSGEAISETNIMNIALGHISEPRTGQPADHASTGASL